MVSHGVRTYRTGPATPLAKLLRSGRRAEPGRCCSCVAALALLPLRCCHVVRWLDASRPPGGVSAFEGEGVAACSPCPNSMRGPVVPRSAMPSGLDLPPVVRCRGTSRSRAGRSRVLRNALPRPIAAASAMPLSASMPGTIGGRICGRPFEHARQVRRKRRRGGTEGACGDPAESRAGSGWQSRRSACGDRRAERECPEDNSDPRTSGPQSNPQVRSA